MKFFIFPAFNFMKNDNIKRCLWWVCAFKIKTFSYESTYKRYNVLRWWHRNTPTHFEDCCRYLWDKYLEIYLKSHRIGQKIYLEMLLYNCPVSLGENFRVIVHSVVCVWLKNMCNANPLFILHWDNSQELPFCVNSCWSKAYRNI